MSDAKFDVFLSHNSNDKPAVRALVDALEVRGIKVWLDERELIPGRPWQEALEQIIQTSNTAIVAVGRDGLGPWENREMRSCLSAFVEREMPVIPVLLPSAPTEPDMPIFLKQYTWVDFRKGLNDTDVDRLVWGITGAKPSSTLNDSTIVGPSDSEDDSRDVVSKGDLLDGRYHIQNMIGRGGFSTIYLAHDVQLDSKVAIRIVRSREPYVRKLVDRQVAILKTMNHRGTPRLISAGTLEDGTRYIAEEFVDGRTLSHHIESGPLSAKQCLDVMEALSDVLCHAHAARIIHRDIKPQNVLIPDRPNGPQFDDAKLLDFGLADSIDDFVVDGQIVGTLQYMPPEQYRAHALTPAADVYGLGVVFFCMKFGRPPFHTNRGGVAEVLAGIARGEVEIPETPPIGRNTRDLIEQCLQKDASRRPQTACEVLSLVRGIKELGEGTSFAPLRLSSAVVVALLLVIVLMLSAFRFPPWNVGGAGIIAASFGAAMGAGYWLANQHTLISKYAANVLAGSEAHDFLTQSLAIQVDSLLERCRRIDEQFLAQSVAIMIQEYHRASESSDRQAALLNSVSLLEKLVSRMTPWYVRHSNTIGVLIALSGLGVGIAVIISH